MKIELTFNNINNLIQAVTNESSLYTQIYTYQALSPSISYHLSVIQKSIKRYYGYKTIDITVPPELIEGTMGVNEFTLLAHLIIYKLNTYSYIFEKVYREYSQKLQGYINNPDFNPTREEKRIYNKSYSHNSESSDNKSVEGKSKTENSSNNIESRKIINEQSPINASIDVLNTPSYKEHDNINNDSSFNSGDEYNTTTNKEKNEHISGTDNINDTVTTMDIEKYQIYNDLLVKYNIYEIIDECIRPVIWEFNGYI